LSKLIALDSASALQRSDTNLLLVLLYASVTSALMSWTLKVTPLRVTGYLGSGMRIAAGAQAWQMPHHVGMQKPAVWPPRIAQTSPILLSHCALVVHAVRERLFSMPWFRETAASTSVTLNARPYLADADSLLAPSHLWLMLSS